MDKVLRIEQLIRELDERFARLENAAHVPRTKPLPSGTVSTVLKPYNCDESCPTCAAERRLFRHRPRLGSIYRDLLGEIARDHYNYKERERETNRANAKKGSMSREPSLSRRGLICVLDEEPSITAEKLRGWLDNMPRTYEDDNGELKLYLRGDDIVVEDLESSETATIKKSHQREYLRRARHS